MRSKYRRRTSPPPAPRPRAVGLTSVIVVGVVLVALGATLALGIERLLPSGSGTAAVTAASTAPSSAAAAPSGAASSPSASAQPAASSAPSAAPSPAAPVLEAQMPHVINGTTLTIQSATNPASLGTNSSSRALSAAMASLGKKPGDLEIAEAYDPAGALALTVLGFRLAGVDPVKLRTVVLEAWLSTRTPGVTSSSVTLSGTPTTKVTYGDGGPTDFVLVHGDSTFVVVTSDQALAASAVAAIAAPSAASPAGASPSAPPAGASPAGASPQARRRRPHPRRPPPEDRRRRGGTRPVGPGLRATAARACRGGPPPLRGARRPPRRRTRLRSPRAS